jgi:predicted enzyme related to lactoylglutathione lyase
VTNAEPLFRKIDCLSLHVTDLDEALAFYRDALGHELRWRSETGAGLGMPESDSELVLQTERPGTETDVLVESADAAGARMQAAGATVLVQPFDIPVGRCAVVRDPWGNTIVLLDLSKRTFVTDEQGYVTGIQPRPEIYRLERDLSREQLIDELAALPERLRDTVGNHDAATLERRPAPDAWSAFDVCKHLRDASQVYGMRFKWIILQDDPVLANYDEDGWVAKHPDRASDIDRLIDEIVAYRAETVRLLRSLAPEGWERTGRHEVLGVVTLEPYVRHEVEHESQHLAQLREARG